MRRIGQADAGTRPTALLVVWVLLAQGRLCCRVLAGAVPCLAAGLGSAPAWMGCGGYVLSVGGAAYLASSRCGCLANGVVASFAGWHHPPGATG